MRIQQLNLQHFRNIESAALHFSAGTHLITGPNGAGKSSILEALYTLAYGRSFRSSQLNHLVMDERSELQLFCELERDSIPYKLGFSRQRTGQNRVLLNGENLSSLSQLCQYLPALLLSTGSYRYFTDGPKLRRSFINWGLFYSEPSFAGHWQQFSLALKQRNAALKQHLARFEVALWDEALISHAEAIHQARAAYVEALSPYFATLLQLFLPDMALSLRYLKGWNKDLSLLEALNRSQQDDYRLGYTSTGPHRADLQLFHRGSAVHHRLSQGQQKLAAYALHLAQGQLLQEKTGLAPLYLLDDLPSELDTQKLSLMAEALQDLGSQVFITAISSDLLPKPLFHHENTPEFQVDQGKVTEPQPANHCFT